MDTCKRFFTAATALALLLAGASAGAAAADLEQRLNDEVQSLLLRLVDSGEVQPDQLADVTISAEPTRRAELGAVVDIGTDLGDGGAAANAGVPVLAVTPGGNAAALGLRAGDRIVAVDGMPLPEAAGGGRAATELLQQRLESGAGDLRLTVLRDGARHELSGPVRAYTLPGYRLQLGTALATASLAATGAEHGCGRISIFDTAPRKDHVYPAVVIAIDGRAPMPSSGPSYRVRPGHHVLTVAEGIDPQQFGDLQRLQRDRRSDGGYKALELVVEPGITYRIGSRFLLERRSYIRDNSYWEPVVYAELAEPCN